jgi:hypothetical protein
MPARKLAGARDAGGVKLRDGADGELGRKLRAAAARLFEVWRRAYQVPRADGNNVTTRSPAPGNSSATTLAAEALQRSPGQRRKIASHTPAGGRMGIDVMGLALCAGTDQGELANERAAPKAKVQARANGWVARGAEKPVSSVWLPSVRPRSWPCSRREANCEYTLEHDERANECHTVCRQHVLARS